MYSYGGIDDINTIPFTALFKVKNDDDDDDVEKKIKW